MIGVKMIIINIIPIGEVEKHEETYECLCNPQLVHNGIEAEIIVHNLYGGKKYFVILRQEKKWSKQDFLHI